ncbi:MAG: sulfatase-like hydrolase/transferase, partial [Hyphomonas sp.]|nr:sulfatase-like hydrolase/transferase [Hyphomonas sp.]
YKKTWDIPLPASLREPLDAPGRPKAHGEFLKVWDYVLGRIPMEDERWRRFNDYYINCMRDVDQQIFAILNELDALGLSGNTVIIFTSDHGEAAGAHGLHGKGPFAYQETMHLPLYVVHPDVRGGADCKSLTSHMDFVPTLLAMAGVPAGKQGDIAGRELAGKDISTVFTNPGSSGVHAVRDSVLFTYSGLVTNDHEIFKLNTEAKVAGKKPIIELIKAGYMPDMKKRGSLRTVFDGRYKFSRYFSPLERNRPRTLDDIYNFNEVELFDLESDPIEVKNLANDRKKNADLVLTMSEKLEAIIKTEIGVDDGREMPNIPTIDWTIDKVDL